MKQIYKKITEEHSIYLFSEKIACSSATVEPTGCLFSPRIPNQFRNLVIQAVCLDQFLQRDVHPVSFESDGTLMRSAS